LSNVRSNNVIKMSHRVYYEPLMADTTNDNFTSVQYRSNERSYNIKKGTYIVNYFEQYISKYIYMCSTKGFLCLGGIFLDTHTVINYCNLNNNK